MHSRVLITVLVVALTLACGSVVLAAGCCGAGRDIKVYSADGDKPKTNENYQPDSVTIGIGRFDLLNIKTGAVGVSVAEREVIVYARLVEILSNGPVNPGAVCVCMVRSAPTVFVGPYRLISAYPQDGAAFGRTPAEVAAMWARQVAEIIPLVAPTNAAVKSGVGDRTAPWKKGEVEATTD